MRTLRLLWAAPAALLLSCAGYGAPDEVLFGVAVYTQPAPGFDFGPLGTYYLDTSMTVKEDSETSRVEPMPQAVENAIRGRLAALGYTDGVTLDAADVGLKAAVVIGTGEVWYPGYWCDPYWGYYGCYYDWYYAGSYQYGTVMLEMGDLRAYPPAAGDQLPVAWLAALYGVASGVPGYDPQRIANAVERAFDQSPYLDTH